MALGELEKATYLTDLCGTLINQMSPRLVAEYHKTMSILETKKGNVFSAIHHASHAADSFAYLESPRDAWVCWYNSAYTLYTVGYFDYAAEAGLNALQAVSGNPEFLYEERITCYFLGFVNHALGRLGPSRGYFDRALSLTDNDVLTTIRALLGKASCEVDGGNLDDALSLSQQAMRIASSLSNVELVAESLSCASICHIKLGDHQQALDLLTQILAVPGLSTEMKRKACRELLLIVTDAQGVDYLPLLERTLERLVNGTKAGGSEWERVKDRWALTKSRIVRGELGLDVGAIGLEFAGEFARLGIYRDASEILRFTSRQLFLRGEERRAFEVLDQAYDLRSRA